MLNDDEVTHKNNKNLFIQCLPCARHHLEAVTQFSQIGKAAIISDYFLRHED